MAFYNHGNILMEVSEEQLLSSWKEFFSTGTNWKDLDKNMTIQKYNSISDKEHLKKILSMPVHFLLESGKGFFVKRDGVAIGLREELRPLIDNPGDYFNIEVRQNLKQSYRGLFSARTQFYDNFNKFLSYKQAKETAKAGKLLDENYRLSVEMSEYKQVIFDILSPLTEQAEKELLADEPLKDQIMAMRKMSGTVQSIMNLYSRKHALDGMRIDMKMAELKKELEAAKKLPAVTGYDEEQKNYYSFLSSVESFMKDMQKARDKGAYSDADYNAMSEAYEYGLSVI